MPNVAQAFLLRTFLGGEGASLWGPEVSLELTEVSDFYLKKCYGVYILCSCLVVNIKMLNQRPTGKNGAHMHLQFHSWDV